MSFFSRDIPLVAIVWEIKKLRMGITGIAPFFQCGFAALGKRRFVCYKSIFMSYPLRVYGLPDGNLYLEPPNIF